MRTKEYAINARIAAIARYKATFADLQGRIQKLRRQSAGLKRGLDTMRRAGDEFGRTLKFMAGGAFAAGGGLFLLQRTAAVGDVIAKTADRLKLSIATYQEYDFASQRAGLSTTQYQDAMEILSRRIGEAKNNQGELTSFLRQSAPVFLEQIKAVEDTDEAMELLARAFEKIEDPAQKAVLANVFFGRSGKRMINLLQGGEEGLAALRERFRELGGGISEKAARAAENYQDRLLDLKVAATSIWSVVSERLLPAMSALANETTNYLVANRADVVDKMRTAFAALGDAAQGVRAVFSVVVPVVTTLVDLFGGWRNVGIALATVFAGKLAFSIFGMVTGLSQMAFGLVGLVKSVPAVIAGIKSVSVATLALGKVFLANPIVLTAVAIAGAAALIIANWGSIADYFRGVFRRIEFAFDQGFVRGVAQVLMEFNPTVLLANAVNGMVKWLFGIDLLRIGRDWVSSLFDGFLSGVRTGFLQLNAWMAKGIAALLKPLSNVAGFFGFEGEIEKIRSGFAGANLVLESAIKADADRAASREVIAREGEFGAPQQQNGFLRPEEQRVRTELVLRGENLPRGMTVERGARDENDRSTFDLGFSNAGYGDVMP